MKQIILVALLLSFRILPVHAQYTITNNRTAEQLASQLQGDGIEILNAEIICIDSFQGIYSGLGELGIDEGIVLATNHTDMIFKDYDFDDKPRNGYTTYAIFSQIDSYYINRIITDFNVPEPYNLISWHGCGLKVDFIPFNDNIAIDYAFADAVMDLVDNKASSVVLNSDAVPFRRGYNYRTSPRCDLIGIFLSGNEYIDTINLAVYPDEPTVPVNFYSLLVDTAFVSLELGSSLLGGIPQDSIWWAGVDRKHYVVDNTDGEAMPYFNYPKFTEKMHATAKVQACDTYQLVLAIAGTQTRPFGDDGVVMELGGSAVFFDKLVSPGQHISCEDTGLSIPAISIGEQWCTAYPNPFRSGLQVQLPHPTSIAAHYKVRVLDVLGRSCYLQEGNLSAINKSLSTLGKALEKGVYMLQIEDTKTAKTQTIKIVRE